VHNYTRDEGRPFGFGDQVADPKPPQAAVVKSDGGGYFILRALKARQVDSNLIGGE
jgi:hypothetical protein